MLKHPLLKFWGNNFEQIKFFLGEEIMKSKKAKALTYICIISLLIPLLFLTNIYSVQSQEPANDNYEELPTMAESASSPEDGSPGEDEENLGLCLFAALFDTIAEITACNDDPRCTTTALFSMVLDFLLCVNPDNENVIFVACITDVFEELLVISEMCGQDQVCYALNITPLIGNIVDCVEQVQE
jgi:hypothetical protein